MQDQENIDQFIIHASDCEFMDPDTMIHTGVWNKLAKTS